MPPLPLYLSVLHKDDFDLSLHVPYDCSQTGGDDFSFCSALFLLFTLVRKGKRRMNNLPCKGNGKGKVHPITDHESPEVK
jgi:hypothetical protein